MGSRSTSSFVFCALFCGFQEKHFFFSKEPQKRIQKKNKIMYNAFLTGLLLVDAYINKYGALTIDHACQQQAKRMSNGNFNN